jgi:hypothetical protein
MALPISWMNDGRIFITRWKKIFLNGSDRLVSGDKRKGGDKYVKND